MIRVVASRVASAVPILILVSLITFGMIHLIPGGPAAAIAGVSASPEQIAQINHNLGLDKPLPCSSTVGTTKSCTAISGPCSCLVSRCPKPS
jgi:ABC-type dipeptide/oligopeptide/nickel transport system permease component